MQVTDATFLAMMQGGTSTQRAGKAEVARYQKLVASARFVAWHERLEAKRMDVASVVVTLSSCRHNCRGAD